MVTITVNEVNVAPVLAGLRACSLSQSPSRMKDAFIYDCTNPHSA
jgi:hypothetical protein